MTQNVNEESVSSFNDVSNAGLRAYNRGAVLANIFEDHYRDGGMPVRLLPSFIQESDTYLHTIPEDETSDAKASMREHLKGRGFVM